MYDVVNKQDVHKPLVLKNFDNSAAVTAFAVSSTLQSSFKRQEVTSDLTIRTEIHSQLELRLESQKAKSKIVPIETAFYSFSSYISSSAQNWALVGWKQPDPPGDFVLLTGSCFSRFG